MKLSDIQFIKVEYLDPWGDRLVGGFGWKVDKREIRSFRKRVEKMRNAFNENGFGLGIRKCKIKLTYN
jgi:hypothetical protein